jgi:uncharacterized membrane protein YccC
VSDWIGQGGRASVDGAAARLVAEIEAFQDDEAMSGWDGLLHAGALARLREIVELWHDCLSLRDLISKRQHSGEWRPSFRQRRVVPRTRHYDYPMLAFSAGSAVLATLLSCFIWISTEWAQGAGFVTMVAVACSFFATLDRPAPMVSMMLKWSSISLVVAAVYLFAILPSVNSLELVIVALAPPFLLLGVLITKPQYMLIGMLMAVNSATFIALTDRYTSDFSSFGDQSLAAVLGIGFALVWFLITRPFGAELAAKRLVFQGWTDLARAAAGRSRGDHDLLAGRVLDRLGQLVPRLAAIENRDLKTVDGFADVRLGFNVVMLQQHKSELDSEQAGHMSRILSGVEDFYRARVKARAALQPPEGLLSIIDNGLRALALTHPVQHRETVDALVGVRRALFPDAAPPGDWPEPKQEIPSYQIAAE